MISKDESIVTQVAAKIASDLTTHTKTDGTAVDVQATYLNHFDFVRELLVGLHSFSGTNSPAVQTVSVETVSPTRSQQVADSFGASYETGSGLQIKGTAHGPIPAWLVTACQKAGVTSVWDNRDTATPANKRPLFKAADGTNSPAGQPLAFWQPR